MFGGCAPPKRRGRLAAERRGGFRFIVVGARLCTFTAPSPQQIGTATVQRLTRSAAEQADEPDIAFC